VGYNSKLRKKKTKGYHFKKKWVIICVIMPLILLSAVGVYLYINSSISNNRSNNDNDLNNSKKLTVSVCNSEIIKNYNDVIGSGNTDNLESQFNKIANNIKLKPGYDKDTNCLFIMTNYYLCMYDKVNARWSYDKFKAAISSGNSKLSSKLNAPYDSKSFDDAVKRLENRNGDRG